jgi:radical SAM superfamily enzyme YgiQ (UPF0313 family)
MANPHIIFSPDGHPRGSVTLIAAWLRQRDDNGKCLPARLPLGILHLAAAAQRAGFAVEIRDTQLLDRDSAMIYPPALLQQILENTAPVVGISCMNDLLPAVLVAIEQFKLQNPDAFVVLGGPGPSSVAVELLQEFPYIDAIVRGEGEQTFVELLIAFYEKRLLPEVHGLYCRSAGAIECTPPRPRLTNLDALLPLPYSTIPLDQYAPTLPVITSRGCPYPCSFCDVAYVWGHKTTWHSINGVVQTLTQLAMLGTQRVAFVDDTFVLKRDRVMELCHVLAEHNIGIHWHCNGRINLMDEDTLVALVAAGCGSIFYGLESGSPSTLRYIRKGFTPEDARQVVALSARYVQVTVSFIWGFPEETWEDFQLTRELYWQLSQIPRVNVQLYLLTPYPGVPIYLQHKQSLLFDSAIRSHIRHAISLTAAEELLIRRYPTLFPSFYHFPTPHLADKLARVEVDRLALSSWSAYGTTSQ